MTTTTRSHAAREAKAVSGNRQQAAQAVAEASSNDAKRPYHLFHSDTSWTPGHKRNNESDELPRFTINLSLPPEQRYAEVCATLKDEIVGLPAVFDEHVGGMVPWLPIRWFHFVCWLLLRGVYDREQNAELKGISRATGVPMYLLVGFNVLLDLFMGCSSGAAAANDGQGGRKMLHFRTLDWGMPELRRIIIQLDFVNEEGGPVIGSTINYAGFVGVLTGVRRDLSVSLNFRPTRNDRGQRWADVSYAWHLIMILLGIRPSITSILRSYVLPKQDRLCVRSSGPASYREIVSQFTARKTFTSSPCYITLCCADEATVVEKDRITAITRSSDTFVVVTNNDEHDLAPSKTADASKVNATFAMALADIVEEAQDRKQCAEDNYQLLLTSKRESGVVRGKKLLDAEDVVKLVQQYPTTNEMTHFGCVMDPAEGRVRWCRRWNEPVSGRWIKEHMSEGYEEYVGRSPS